MMIRDVLEFGSGTKRASDWHLIRQGVLRARDKVAKYYKAERQTDTPPDPMLGSVHRPESQAARLAGRS